MTDPTITKVLTSALPAADLCDLPFDDHFVRSLPADPSTVNRPRQVHEACYTWVEPTPVRAPRLLAWSNDLGNLLGISRPATVTSAAVEVLAGNRLLPGMRPFATCYGGHQFGQWAGQLGDGRAISLAEVISRTGQRWELQLKGAGSTPYSRRADGRAVLRSSLREFLCSEAMHHLGIPTTRALSLVTTGEPVLRDMFYDGHPQDEPGAIVCRVAPSFVRLGNFELFASRSEVETLRRLANYVMATHFPELGPPSPASYAAWFTEVCRRTAVMIAHWMRVGFVHGVMNTDNLSILGLTIDYGPYGWLEPYDPAWTPNTTDESGRRYCYANQPRIGLWNLAQFGRALHPLLETAEGIEAGLAVYRTTFEQTYRELMAAKLGLGTLDDTDDETLLADLLELLRLNDTDWTIFFRKLADVPMDAQSDAALIEPLRAAYYALAPRYEAQIAGWLRRYLACIRRDPAEPAVRQVRMRQANPKFVLRNYLAQQAIDAAEDGDPSLIESLLNVMRHPCDEQPAHEALAGKRPEWARHKPGCSALSCSS
ncbi:MAG: protein adenylyltransferase SelO [Candidatus Competibacter phosphatis]